MKTLGLLGLVSILIYTNAYSGEGWVRVPVQDMKATELDGVFEIESSEHTSKIKLDCLSFIHGMNFYDINRNQEWELSYSFPLSEYQCNEIHKFLKDSLKENKPACVELNVVDEVYELSRKEESCRLGS